MFISIISFGSLNKWWPSPVFDIYYIYDVILEGAWKKDSQGSVCTHL